MGALYCLVSAAAFGAMAVFAKLAFDAGASVGTLLVVRFGLAGAVLLALALARGALRGLSRSTVLAGLAMGAFGYVLQAGLYFSALRRIDASLVALVFYVYPVLVMAAGVALGRDRVSRRTTGALATALAGMALVLGGSAVGALDGVGVLLALGAAVTYTGYILVGDRVTGGVSALGLAALVCVGAFGTLLAHGVAGGGVDLAIAPVGWLWLGALALVSTVAAILLFFAGLARVGPSKAALLSNVEPVVTVAAAAAVFGEALSPGQWLGAALVLVSVGIAQWPKRVAVAVPTGAGRPARSGPEYARLVRRGVRPAAAGARR